MNDKDLTVSDVFNGLTEEQKNTVYTLIGRALKGEAVDCDALKGRFSQLEISVVKLLVKEALK